MTSIALVLLFVLSSFQGMLFGQNVDASSTQSLKFKNISLNDGLSQSSVLCILQDNQGFLWFGTRDGLNKYDGHTFTVYRHVAKDSTSLSDSYVKSLFQDERGNLWVGTRNGLNKYDAKNDMFHRYVHSDSGKTDVKDEIWSIIGDGKDNLWIGTNFGLGQVAIKTGEIKYRIHVETDNGSLSSNLVRALVKTKEGDLWVQTVQGIDRFDHDSDLLKHYAYPEGAFEMENTNYVSDLFEDSQNNLWIGFKNGLARFNIDIDSIEFLKMPSSNEKAITDEVRSIYEDDRNNLWVGTYGGLYVLNPQRNSISHIVHDENDPNSLSQNSIYEISGDTKGDVWIGTYAGGLNYYNRNYDQFKHLSSGANPSKLNYKVVSSIVDDPDGNLWIGTEGGGLNRYDRKTGEFTYYTHNTADANSLSADNVKTIIWDHAGNLWIGTHDGGLNFLNPQIQPFSFKKYLNNPEDPKSLGNDRIISLFEDHENNLWIGTSGGGLNVLNPKTESFEIVGDRDRKVGEIIFTISETTDKNILLVGGDKGLAKIDIHTKKLSPVPFKGGSNSASISTPVLCTYRGFDNQLWVGTEGDGLYSYVETSNTVKRYGVEEGLPNDMVYGIVPQGKNAIWLSTNHGLSRLDLQTNQFKNFDASDGLQSNEFNYGAYLKNEEGELLFGGVNGLTVFDPDRITENPFIPPVDITSFRVNNEAYSKSKDSDQSINLAYDENVLDFNYVALSYSQPDKNQYAYKLEGFDTKWNYVGNNKSAKYTNLDAGDYIFKVKASNNDGLWNEKGESLAVTILPAPWLTWWAFLLYTFLIFGALWSIRKNGIRRIHDKNQLKQERLEKERIEEVNNMKLQLFTNISHDFRTPLTLIMGPLERMLKAKDGNDSVQRQHETMHRNASVLMQLINQVLDFRKAESEKMELWASKDNIVKTTEKVKEAFDELARSRNIDYSLSVSQKDITVWFDRVMLKKVLFNLLSNAFKFVPDNGRIHIKIDSQEKPKKDMPEGCVKISVKDNGKGIPMEKMKLIFERFYKYGERFGTGIGLALAKSLVELHHGHIKVKSAENKGAVFTVFLPLGNTHLNREQMVENGPSTNGGDLYDHDKAFYSVDQLTAQNSEEIINSQFDTNLPSILVVEDNREVRDFIKSIFQGTYNLFEAPDGKIAIEIAKTSPTDLIISDVMMPVMDGMELCHEIKSNIATSHIPVVLLTARTSDAFQKSGYRTGADAYITKPFDADILEVRVNNLIKSRRLLIEKFKKDIILSPKEVTATSADEEFLQKAIEIVEENMTDSEFTVQVFIDQMNMSRSALYRKLKSLTDQSLTEFIRVIKLKRAAQLMLKTEMNISEIGFELGFNDQKYFRKSFKKLFKKTPSNYRAENSADVL